MCSTVCLCTTIIGVDNRAVQLMVAVPFDIIYKSEKTFSEQRREWVARGGGLAEGESSAYNKSMEAIKNKKVESVWRYTQYIYRYI